MITRLDITKSQLYYTVDKTLYMCKCLGVSGYEYVCTYMYIFVCVIIKNCDKISSTGTNKQLKTTCGYIAINKTKQR